jgi:hypothetical protein
MSANCRLIGTVLDRHACQNVTDGNAVRLAGAAHRGPSASHRGPPGRSRFRLRRTQCPPGSSRPPASRRRLRPALPRCPPTPWGSTGGGAAGRKNRCPAVLFGAGAAGALAVAVAAVAVIWGELGTSGAAVDDRDGSGDSGSNAQGLSSPGAPGQPGTGASTGPSGRSSPSATASAGPRTRGGRGASGTPRDGSGSGGGDTGGGGTAPGPTNPSGSSAPSGPSARIEYFTVGSGGTCYARGESFPFRYSIVGSRNPTPIEFSIYFDGRLGVGHPINTAGEPAFTISTSRSEDTAGTHTYRMVLRSPTHQEKTVSVRVC